MVHYPQTELRATTGMQKEPDLKTEVAFWEDTLDSFSLNIKWTPRYIEYLSKGITADQQKQQCIVEDTQLWFDWLVK